MELTEDQIVKKYSKHCGHCSRNILLLSEYVWICFGCGYNLINRKNKLSKTQRKKINFVNRLKNAEHKLFCICVDVYINFEGDDFDKIFELLSTLKNKKVKKNNILIEKYKRFE